MSPPEPDRQREFAVDVVRRLRGAGFEALWAGGCVRDHLLGLTPKDYDVATSATPDEIRELFGRRRTIAVGAAFGVMTVVGPAAAGQIEVATFRRDESYSDGRRPDAVTYTDAREDARRRDFTINGVFFDPLTEQVQDYVDGQADLARRVIRAIGEPTERFTEDKLRMLRAVRFAATFDFALDPATLAAVQQMAGEIHVVSVERIAAEMRRMLTLPRRRLAVELLHATGLLAALLPEVAALAPAAWTATLDFLATLAAPRFPLALAGLLGRAVDAAGGERICRRWRLSNDEVERVVWLLAHQHALDDAHHAPWSTIQRVLIAPGAEDLATWLAAKVRLGEAVPAALDFCRERLTWPAEQLNPPPLITGDDLIGLGIPQGKAYRTLLDRTRDAQLDGTIATRNEALQLIERFRDEPNSD